MDEIFANVKGLTVTDERIIAYLLKNRIKIDEINIKQITKNTFTSAASVTRLSKKLGYSGFSELKYAIKAEGNTPEETGTNTMDFLRNDMEKTSHFIDNYNFNNFNAVINESEKIFVFGTDWGERNATEYLVRNFMSIGIDIISIPSITELKWMTERYVKNSTFIIVSFSGENKELLENVQRLRIGEANIVSVTRFSNNQLSLIAPINLYYHTTRSKAIDRHLEYNLFAPLHLLLDAMFGNYFITLNEKNFNG